MASFRRLYEAECAKVRAFERVRCDAANRELLRAALGVINKHGLAGEFVDAITAVPDTEDK